MAHAATPVRCSGCKRTVAWAMSKDSLRHSVYCDSWCASEPAVTDKEERNDLWDALIRNDGRSASSIAKLYGLAHSLVYKTIDRRRAEQTSAS